MCGIVGYIGKNNGVTPVLDGLTALEYRGYDSAGIACIDGKTSKIVKQVGEVQGVRDKAAEQGIVASHLAIGQRIGKRADVQDVDVRDRFGPLGIDHVER